MPRRTSRPDAAAADVSQGRTGKWGRDHSQGTSVGGGDGKSAPPSLGHHSGARETGFWVSMSGSRTEKEEVLETSQEKNL